jgi:hypothetical protein
MSGHEFEEILTPEERAEARKEKAEATRRWFERPASPYADPVAEFKPAQEVYNERSEEELKEEGDKLAAWLNAARVPPSRDPAALGGPGPVKLEPEAEDSIRDRYNR